MLIGVLTHDGDSLLGAQGFASAVLVFSSTFYLDIKKNLLITVTFSEQLISEMITKSNENRDIIVIIT